MGSVSKEMSGVKEESGKAELLSKLEDTLESQYQCPTCLELFISPVALNCGHTYCWLCLAQWKGSSGRTRGDLGTCPTCREVVQHENRVFAIDHMIEAMVEQLGEEKKKERIAKVKERKGKTSLNILKTDVSKVLWYFQKLRKNSRLRQP